MGAVRSTRYVPRCATIFAAMEEPVPGPTSTVAERLKWARIMRGYTSPRNAATVLALPVETYRKHENGERGRHGLKEHHIKRYARAFQVNSVWLATGKQSPTGADLVLTPEEIQLIRLMREAKKTA